MMIRRTVVASFDTDLAPRRQPRTLWTPSRRLVIGGAAVVGIGALSCSQDGPLKSPGSRIFLPEWYR
jgi:hypothetical protein